MRALAEGRLLVLCCMLLLPGCARLPRPPGWEEEPAVVHPPLVTHPPASLPAPEGLRATSGEYRRIPLQWDPLLRGEVGGYRIERSGSRDGPFRPLAEIWGRGMTARVDGAGEAPLGDAVTRYYRIRAFTPEGRLSERVSEVVVGTTAPLPDPPQGLQAYSRQPRQVPLSWQPSPDPHVAGYRVERSPTSDGPFERIAELAGRHAIAHVDEGLGDLRVFYYRVAAVNPDGVPGPWSEPVRAVTKPAPLPPLALRVESQQLGANVLRWEPNVEEDIAEYRLYRRFPDAPPRLVTSVPAGATRARDPGVAAGESATYVLVAVDRDGLASRPSEPVVAEGTRYAVAADATPERVRLRWDPRSDEGFAGARIERVGWLGSRVLGSSADGEFIDREVEPGGIYRYVVVLTRPDAGEAPPSRPIDVRVPEADESP
jgi:hypothetical protein